MAAECGAGEAMRLLKSGNGDSMLAPLMSLPLPYALPIILDCDWPDNKLLVLGTKVSTRQPAVQSASGLSRPNVFNGMTRTDSAWGKWPMNKATNLL